MTNFPEGPLTGSNIEDNQFRRLVDSIEDYAIYILNKDGRIMSWNEGAIQIKGYARNEVIGQHFSLFYSNEDIEKNIPEVELEQARRQGSYTDEGWRLRKNGSRFWASVVTTTLFDQDGNLQGYTTITKDMTDRKRLEERFRKVVESAPNAMVMINEAGRIEPRFLC